MKTLINIIIVLAAVGLWMAIDPQVDKDIKVITKETVKHSKGIFEAAAEGWNESDTTTVTTE